MPYRLRDVRPDDPQDVERLADMFNDWDSAWPGGFHRGNPMTPETMRDQLRRHRRLARLIVETDDEIVGYCDLDAQAGQTELAYIPLLGARLSHHGRGVGKMLLREMVRRVTDLGYRELGLDTWPGNEKAVPLYKKTGFNWVPDTQVDMRNFLPTILSIPEGRAFFAGRDWYDCFERAIEIAPDDVTWNGMKVYPYRFRDGDDYLDLTFDGASGGLTALETPEYAVSCYLPAEEAPAGETFPVTWEIRSKAGRTLEAVLLAEGEPGLDLSVQERFSVKDEATLTRDLRVTPDARPRRGGRLPHRVKSTLLIGGQPVALETGVKVVLPVEIEYGGQGLFVGREERIEVRLRSRLDRPLEGWLALDPSPGIACDDPAPSFSLPAKSWTRCEFRLTACEGGVFESRLRLGAGETRQDRAVFFRAFEGGETRISIDREDESATLETPGLRVAVDLRGGGFDLHGPDRRYVGQTFAELGPPFKEWPSRPPLSEARLEDGPQGLGLTLAVPSREFPGLVTERTLRIVSDDLVRVDYRVKNLSDAPIPAQLRAIPFPHLGAYLTLPTPDGLLREPVRGWGGWPNGETDALARGAALVESWAALEEEGRVCGLLWQGEAEQEMWGLPVLRYDLGEIPAHSAKSAAPFYLLGGGGDWKTARRWWRRLIQPSGIQEAVEPEPLRVLEARFDPPTALLTSDRQEVRVALLNRRGSELNGRLTLCGEFLGCPVGFPLEKVNRDRPFSAAVVLRSPDRPVAGFVRAEADSGPETDAFQLAAIRLAGEGETAVSESEGRLTVDNGWLRFVVAPDFAGSMISLERDGTNHLLSAYPQPRPFIWFNPWFGGVHPFLNWMADDALAKETFAGEPVERTGERGIRWRGVRVSCRPQHKDRRWLALETEYLTAPGSAVLALVNRWANLSDARMDFRGGVTVWAQAGGGRESASLHWLREGERRTRRGGGFERHAVSDRWSAIVHEKTGDVLLAVAGDPRAQADGWYTGEEGPHLSVNGGFSVGPNETLETLSWLVLSDDAGQIDAYAELSKVTALP
jgi:ribosomal protein S18 acetylase RimI-like enzyme